MRKTTIIILTIFILFLPWIPSAGIHEPDPSNKFKLNAANFIKYHLTDEDKRWQASLIKNIKPKGKGVESYFTFVKTDLSYSHNGSLVTDSVYVNINNNFQFLIYSDTQRFLIDFESKSVLKPGGGGLSFHIHPGKSVITVLLPSGITIGGIPISSGGRSPNFDKSSVSWY